MISQIGANCSNIQPYGRRTLPLKTDTNESSVS